jgi:aminopeptidase N
VRPSSYVKIDNFYTATVYEKGAELIRMLKTLLGDEVFRRGCDLYFERLDGTAATVEEFMACFEEAAERDLSAFMRWYEQAGTPELTIETDYDRDARTLEVRLRQATGPTPGQPEKAPVPIPVRLGLLDRDGRTLSFSTSDGTAEETVVVLTDDDVTVRLTDVAREPVVSALRGYSAPVKLVSSAPRDDGYVLLAADPDLFNRWEAGQALGAELILARAAGEPDAEGEQRWAEAVGRSLSDQSSEAAFKALLLSPPSEADLALMVRPVDPQAIHEAREALRSTLGAVLAAPLLRLHEELADGGAFSPDADAAGRRALRNAALHLLVSAGVEGAVRRAEAHLAASTNMTDALGGLEALSRAGGEPYERALADFYTRWKDEPLVVDKWFALQARGSQPDVLARVVALTTHPAFEPKNPNRLRALVSTFASANPARFHSPDGAGYRFLVDEILAVDAFNPKTAARLVEPLGGWRRLTPELGERARAELERLAGAPNLSKNVHELAAKALA